MQAEIGRHRGRESDREREEDAAKLHASFVASLAARRLQLLVAFMSRLFT